MPLFTLKLLTLKVFECLQTLCTKLSIQKCTIPSHSSDHGTSNFISTSFCYFIIRSIEMVRNVLYLSYWFFLSSSQCMCPKIFKSHLPRFSPNSCWTILNTIIKNSWIIHRVIGINSTAKTILHITVIFEIKRAKPVFTYLATIETSKQFVKSVQS